MDRGVLGWILIGLVAGVLGKAIMPGRDPGGFVVTILLGIAGALLAGFLMVAVGREPSGTLESYAAATGGAVLLLILYRLVQRGRAN